MLCEKNICQNGKNLQHVHEFPANIVIWSNTIDVMWEFPRMSQKIDDHNPDLVGNNCSGAAGVVESASTQL